MDLKPFKLDIDELIKEFAESKFTTLADMKRVWKSRKFSFIFEASPTTNLACFMQSLYAHSIAYMSSTTASLSHRLGGLYCLYCLHETQPFKPPFKIYLSLGELKRLKNLVIDAKRKDIKLVSALVKSMLERNMILFGFVDINEGPVAERVNELTDIQKAQVKVAHKKLFADTRIEHFMHMDFLGRHPLRPGEKISYSSLAKGGLNFVNSAGILPESKFRPGSKYVSTGKSPVHLEFRLSSYCSFFNLVIQEGNLPENWFVLISSTTSAVNSQISDRNLPENLLPDNSGTELDVDLLKKLSSDYAVAKEQAITDASKVGDVENIKHIAKSNKLIGDVVEKTANDWNLQKDIFYRQTGFGPHHTKESQHEDQNDDQTLLVEEPNNENEKVQEDDDNFGMELEELLSNC
ncbi:hypothetical protein LguiA_018929 [Lonicera macranthoides]